METGERLQFLNYLLDQVEPGKRIPRALDEQHRDTDHGEVGVAELLGLAWGMKRIAKKHERAARKRFALGGGEHRRDPSPKRFPCRDDRQARRQADSVPDRRAPRFEKHGDGIRNPSAPLHVRKIEPKDRHASGRQGFGDSRHEGVVHPRPGPMGEYQHGSGAGRLRPKAGHPDGARVKLHRFPGVRTVDVRQPSRRQPRTIRRGATCALRCEPPGDRSKFQGRGTRSLSLCFTEARWSSDHPIGVRPRQGGRGRESTPARPAGVPLRGETFKSGYRTRLRSNTSRITAASLCTVSRAPKTSVSLPRRAYVTSSSRSACLPASSLV